ncbi:trp operon repressor [uncultured Endozoicomonas sp.]|uniref:trp operon repressor n=1 Tax=uncultured Endozoicomonas sp. TaxID=432652 RepID=UPI00261F02A7|nr:trp operon repressor [uncultured Endozoicomonas sp.]
MMYCCTVAEVRWSLEIEQVMRAEPWLQVIKLLSDQQSADSLHEVMHVLLTREEREAIGSRLSIMRALVAGKESQREIAKRIGVSITKVTRCSNYLKTLSASETVMIEPT